MGTEESFSSLSPPIGRDEPFPSYIPGLSRGALILSPMRIFLPPPLFCLCPNVAWHPEQPLFWDQAPLPNASAPLPSQTGQIKTKAIRRWWQEL